MTQVQSFTHPCDEFLDKRIMNYSTIYDNTYRKNLCFGNMLIHEQFILCATNNQTITPQYIEESLKGCDNIYPSSVVYFIPKNDVEKAKSIVKIIVENWTNKQTSGIFYSAYGDIYISMHHTDKGMWLCTYDGTSCVAFELAYTMFENQLSIEESFRNRNLGLDRAFVAFNFEESSGEAFFSHFKKQRKLFSLMTEEGLYQPKNQNKNTP